MIQQIGLPLSSATTANKGAFIKFGEGGMIGSNNHGICGLIIPYWFSLVGDHKMSNVHSSVGHSFWSEYSEMPWPILFKIGIVTRYKTGIMGTC